MDGFHPNLVRIIIGGRGFQIVKLGFLSPQGASGRGPKGENWPNLKNLLLHNQMSCNQILFMDGKVLRCSNKIVNFITPGSPILPWGGGKVYYSYIGK